MSHAEVMQKLWENPSFREKQRVAISEAMKKRWREHGEEQAKAISKGRVESLLCEFDPIDIILDLLKRYPNLRAEIKSILGEPHAAID